MFGKKASWKAEYEDTLYKIYDWDGNLAGYFFPEYSDTDAGEPEDETIDEMNKARLEVAAATLVLPMVKLALLDRQEGMDIDYVISSLEANAERTTTWKNWLKENAKSFGIFGAEVHTAREDRNMLSIGLGMSSTIKLGEKEVIGLLTPLLDKLHEDGLL